MTIKNTEKVEWCSLQIGGDQNDWCRVEFCQKNACWLVFILQRRLIYICAKGSWVLSVSERQMEDLVVNCVALLLYYFFFGNCVIRSRNIFKRLHLWIACWWWRLNASRWQRQVICNYSFNFSADRLKPIQSLIYV